MNARPILMGLLALLALPAVAAQSIQLAGSANANGTAAARAADAHLDADAHANKEVDVQAQVQDPAPDPDGEGLAPQGSPVQEPAAPALSADQQAVVAGAGALVAAGLVAYYWGSLKFLAGSLCAPLFSRIQSNKMLDNDVRNRVYALVGENPGVTIKEVTEVLGIGWGTAVYHLKRLVEERLVVSERQRQFRRYFKNGGGIVNETKSAFGELKNPTNQRLAEQVMSSPGARQKDLCLAVGISAPLAHKYLSRMVMAGLVSTQREWKSVRYYPTPQLQGLWPSVSSTASVRSEPLLAV